ncbi:MAG TPA: hypothetical protein VMR46_00520 [Candidatus Paceibacterota bacterium]|nr:hypothetical protein [Candidatus Paceibacterota bacterium]
MNEYFIEHRIRSISHLAMGDGTDPSFVVDGIIFRQEHFTIQTGPTGDFWFASAKINAADWEKAYAHFIDKLEKITSRISLVSQGYVRFVLEPFLITRSDSFPSTGLFRFTRDRDAQGLLLLQRHGQAIGTLYAEATIPNDFYLYWNDATNTTGYSSKLLLMFAAIEALGRKRNKTAFPDAIDLYKSILGDKLASDIFENTAGLRNQLSHGEYYSAPRNERDFVSEIHKAVVSYFNNEILKSELIDHDVVQPQRNFFENKAGFTNFIKTIDHSKMPDLKEVLTYFLEKEQGKVISVNSFIHTKPPEGF